MLILKKIASEQDLHYEVKIKSKNSIGTTPMKVNALVPRAQLVEHSTRKLEVVGLIPGLAN